MLRGWAWWSSVSDDLTQGLFGATPAERFRQQRHRDAHRKLAEGVKAEKCNAEFAGVLRHFRGVPALFPDLEFYFAITGLGLAEHLLALLLLPLKAVIQPTRIECRDCVAMCMMAVCVVAYVLCGHFTTQLYSFVYHGVRRTSFIKLVLVFSILDVVDKLLSSFCQDALEVVHVCAVDRFVQSEQSCHGDGDGDGARGRREATYSRWLLAGSFLAAAVGVVLHALSLLLAVVTLNVAVNAEGSALVAVLVSNNFNELKSAIFKKYTPESLLSVCAVDALERLQFIVFMLVMVLQHLNERLANVALVDAAVILAVEVLIDFAKILFVSRFNGIPPSVIKGYSQLAILDIASEKLLWRIPNIVVEEAPVPAAHATGREDVAALASLLAPASGFAPKHVKRVGLNAIPYASLVLWSFARLAGYLLMRVPLVFVLTLLTCVLAKLVVSTAVLGVASRFVLRTVVVKPPRWVAPSAALGTAPYHVLKQSTASGVLFGVSPMCTPRSTPVQGWGRWTPLPSKGTTEVRTVVQLSPLLCALMKVDRFDLQAGKAKKEFR